MNSQLSIVGCRLIVSIESLWLGTSGGQTHTYLHHAAQPDNLRVPIPIHSFSHSLAGEDAFKRLEQIPFRNACYRAELCNGARLLESPSK